MGTRKTNVVIPAKPRPGSQSCFFFRASAPPREILSSCISTLCGENSVGATVGRFEGDTMQYVLRHASLAVTALLMSMEQADALPVKHVVYAEKTARVEISLAYPQTGVKAIDDDIKAMILRKAKQFRVTSLDVYQKGDPVYTEDGDYKVERSDQKIFAVSWQTMEDFHGAHPSHEYLTADYLMPDGWRVYLPEVVDGPRGLVRISELARADLDRRLLSGKEPVSDKDWIAKGTTPEAPNFEAFLLLPGKLHIQFQSYQVDCYACDDPTVDMPMAALAGVLRPDPRAPQASFACAKAATPLEHAICSDAHLARLDRQVGETYFTHLNWSDEGSIAAKKEALRAEQRSWLKTRKQKCAGLQVPCLINLYQARIDALEAMTE